MKKPTIASLDARLRVVEGDVALIKAEQKQHSIDMAVLARKLDEQSAKTDELLEMLGDHAALKRVRLSTKAKVISMCIGTALGTAITALIGGCF